MKRRQFIRTAGATVAGIAAAPYILPSGSLFAATGNRRVGHVVFCMFAGGVRNIETVHMNDGNLLPNLITGAGGISPDILGGMTALPAAAAQSLQTFGTVFKEFRYAQGPTGHFNGHTTAITGQYTQVDLNLRERPEKPTVFELYRKHNNPATSALNAWWVSNGLGPYPSLNYSNYPGYGIGFGANMIAANSLVNADAYSVIGNTKNFTDPQLAKAAALRDFLDQQFKTLTPDSARLNTALDETRLKLFINSLYTKAFSGQFNDPLQTGPGVMNGDLYNIAFAEEVITEFKPELLVVNLQGVDVCHSNFTEYCDNIRKSDYAVRHLWDKIQATPGMANDTVLIVAPEHGRNYDPNTLIDPYGRRAFDHTGDASSREIFCLIAGPTSVVKQNQLISTNMGESIDIVPTIAWLLGFDSAIPSGLLPGSPLTAAFN
jgi:hypothetical protein